MKRLAFLSLTLTALAAGVAPPSAEAKFRMTLSVHPTPLWAKKPATVIVRTGIVLARDHGLDLHVVGPGRTRGETGIFYPRLRRTGPKEFTATVRFPRGGTWRLIVPNWNDQGSTSPPPVQRTVRVRPTR
jgi:hypothetical protein